MVFEMRIVGRNECVVGMLVFVGEFVYVFLILILIVFLFFLVIKFMCFFGKFFF